MRDDLDHLGAVCPKAPAICEPRAAIRPGYPRLLFRHSERGPDLADVVVDQRLRGVGRGEHVGHTHGDQLAARGADPGAVERNEVALRATHRAAGDLAPREQAAQVEFLAGGRVARAQQPGRVLGAFGHQIHERCGAIHILPAILQVDARIPRTARPLVVDLGGGDLFAGVRGLEHVAHGIPAQACSRWAAAAAPRPEIARRPKPRRASKGQLSSSLSFSFGPASAGLRCHKLHAPVL